jgi:hypothetical protein
LSPLAGVVPAACRKSVANNCLDDEAVGCGRQAIVGDLVFEPDLSADFYEKWVGFLTILASSIGMAILTSAVAFLTLGWH